MYYYIAYLLSIGHLLYILAILFTGNFNLILQLFFLFYKDCNHFLSKTSIKKIFILVLETKLLPNSFKSKKTIIKRAPGQKSYCFSCTSSYIVKSNN